MAPGTYHSRTYSKKAAAKRKRLSEQDSDADKSDTTSSSGRKRHKIDTNDQAAVPEWRVTRGSTASLSTHKTVKTYGSAAKRARNSPSLPAPSHLKSSSIARDLSDVFDSVTPSQSPVGTPRKVVRRMLARSKTESSLETSPSRGPVLERTPSLPTLPSTPSRDKGKRKEVINPDATLNALPALPRPASNVTRTYAGKSRSFLVTIPASSLGADAALLPPGANVSIGDDGDDYLVRESYSSLRARWGVDNSEDDPYPVDSPNKRRSGSASGTPSGSPSRVGRGSKKGSIPSVPLPPGMMNPLKSITELRSKGENRRFLDEIGYMFEGMSKKGALSLRKTSALDIVTKLCDAEFARKAKAADILGRIWDVFIDAGAGQNEDKILDLLLAFLASLIARDVTSLTELAQRPSGFKAECSKDCTSLVDILFSILASSTSSATSDLLRFTEVGDAELKRAGLTRKDRAQLALIHDVIASKSRLFPKSTPITTPLLITYTLQHLPPVLIPSRHLPILLASCRVSLSPLVSPSQRVTARPSSPLKSIPNKYSSSVASHVNWRELMVIIGFDCAKVHLSLLDSYLLGQWQSSTEEDESIIEEDLQEDELEQAREGWLLEALVALGICSEMRLRSQGNGTGKASECLELVLRILVSRTHADENWSRTLLQNPYSVTWMVRLVAWAGDTYHTLINENTEECHVDAITSEEELNGGESLQMTRDRRDDEEMRWQDRLCLALGLLANIAQSAEEAKDTVRETRVDPSCSLKKSACVHTCCCASPIGGLDVLTRLYTQQERSRMAPTGDADEDEGETRKMLAMMTLLGHIAMLFGLLMRGSPENEAIITGGLPTIIKGEGRKAKLRRLAEQARELVSFDEAVSGEGEIAREVVVFLQELME